MSISLKSVNVGNWNINGFKSKLLGNKIENKNFLSCIKKCDIIGLTETHSPKEDILNIPGFSDPFSVSRPKSKNNKNSGGIAVYVRTYLIDSKAVCQSNNSAFIVPTNLYSVINIKYIHEYKCYYILFLFFL